MHGRQAVKLFLSFEKETVVQRAVFDSEGGVKLALRRVRFRQAQEYENGPVERLHFFGGQ